MCLAGLDGLRARIQYIRITRSLGYHPAVAPTARRLDRQRLAGAFRFSPPGRRRSSRRAAGATLHAGSATRENAVPDLPQNLKEGSDLRRRIFAKSRRRAVAGSQRVADLIGVSA